ncbi:hypothetical protein M3558_24620 [Brevibacillus invocatus]|nr:hypothetical protein [Brevibacillus invocatus]
MLKNLSADQLTQLREYIPFILDYYNAGKKEPQKLPSSSLSTSVPDAMYDSDGLTYNYKRPNTDSPVDDLYKTANIKESDLHLDGKHGMDVTIERRYSSLNSNTNDIYYSSGGTNKRTSFSNYQDEYFMPHGWKLNLPKFEEIDKTNVRCSYRLNFRSSN